MEVLNPNDFKTIIDEYEYVLNKYEKKFGKVMVLYQSGSFYEVYGWKDENGDVHGCAQEASELFCWKLATKGQEGAGIRAIFNF